MTEQPNEAQLTLKDRLNMPYLLANQILTFEKSITVVGSESKTEIVESIKGLLNMIPTPWEDQEFREEIEKAKIQNDVDVRPEWCGLKATKDFCEKHGIGTIKKVDSLDHWKVLKACMNLLFRKGMLSRKTFTEKMTGKPATDGVEEVSETDVEEV